MGRYCMQSNFFSFCANVVDLLQISSHEDYPVGLRAFVLVEAILSQLEICDFYSTSHKTYFIFTTMRVD